MPIDDGGPAFPTYTPETESRCGYYRDGMSLRDYFAARAPSVPQWFAVTRGNYTRFIDLPAEWAYAWADAMIAERAKA